MKFLSLLILTSLVTGCATFPHSSLELSYSGVKSEPFCYGDAPTVIAARLTHFLQKCYPDSTHTSAVATKGFVMPIQFGAGWTVQEEAISSTGKRISLAARLGYALAFDVEPDKGACVTKVQGYALNSIWARRFSTLNEVAEGVNEVKCP
ncbi:hypothetical protein BH11PSE9_BH11PSE9_30610 [soil metagenome]